MIQCQINVGKCLCLYALRRIHHKDRSVTGCKASGYLVVKIHMTRCIDQVEDIFLSVVRLIDDTDCLGFDGNATLPLQIHIVQNLCLHLTAGQGSGSFYDTICKR